jgi:hypothetical protein
MSRREREEREREKEKERAGSIFLCPSVVMK